MSNFLQPPGTLAHQAPLSMDFSSKEYWSGFPCPSPGIFLTQGSNQASCIAGGFFTTAPPGKPFVNSNKLTPGRFYRVTSFEGHEGAHRIWGKAEDEQLLNCPEPLLVQDLLDSLPGNGPSPAHSFSLAVHCISFRVPGLASVENAERKSRELKAAFEERGSHQGDFQQGEVHLQIKLWCWVVKILTHYSNIYGL